MTGKVIVVVACGNKGEIGKDNQLLWDIPLDMKHFRDTTRGRVVVMGRKTFESIGKALPKRPNVVITRQYGYKAEGIDVANDFEDALRLARALTDDEEICIIGGAGVYQQALKVADEVILTSIKAVYPDADKYIDLEQLDEHFTLASKVYAKALDRKRDHDVEMFFCTYKRDKPVESYVDPEPFGIRQTLVG